VRRFCNVLCDVLCHVSDFALLSKGNVEFPIPPPPLGKRDNIRTAAAGGEILGLTAGAEILGTAARGKILCAAAGGKIAVSRTARISIIYWSPIYSLHLSFTVRSYGGIMEFIKNASVGTPYPYMSDEKGRAEMKAFDVLKLRKMKPKDRADYIQNHHKDLPSAHDGKNECCILDHMS
jgi:hypothetical protein